jgi:hypothetical protein
MLHTLSSAAEVPWSLTAATMQRTMASVRVSIAEYNLKSRDEVAAGLAGAR